MTQEIGMAHSITIQLVFLFPGKMDKIKRWGFSATVAVPLFASASMGPENIWDIIEKL